MSDRIIFPSKLVSETLWLEFPFHLPVGATISAETVAVSAYSGASTGLLATSGVANHALQNNVVRQKVTGGTAGTTYALLCSITASDGQQMQKSGFLTVLPSP